ncbi:transcriptional regulator [Rhodoferax aquaticus]|uniref:Transcriptional regulator n=1 Tax=Rhodoferax aquaticus TaxID=2527691 RepID=A0A515EW37_9BURK|nr:transcriptional regulator [Rhodoferax aquaticus]
MRLGLVIRKKREYFDLLQDSLSSGTSLHRTYIGAGECGEKNLTLRNAICFAGGFADEAS